MKTKTTTDFNIVMQAKDFSDLQHIAEFLSDFINPSFIKSWKNDQQLDELLYAFLYKCDMSIEETKMENIRLTLPDQELKLLNRIYHNMNSINYEFIYESLYFAIGEALGKSSCESCNSTTYYNPDSEFSFEYLTMSTEVTEYVYEIERAWYLNLHYTQAIGELIEKGEIVWKEVEWELLNDRSLDEFDMSNKETESVAPKIFSMFQKDTNEYKAVLSLFDENPPEIEEGWVKMEWVIGLQPYLQFYVIETETGRIHPSIYSGYQRKLNELNESQTQLTFSNN